MSNERVTADVWVFDLDNTLYPRDCDLFAQIDVKMKAFVSNLLGIDPADAYKVQKQYFREHGSTLRGLMDNHGLAPQEFLDFVHDIDVTPVPPNPRWTTFFTSSKAARSFSPTAPSCTRRTS